MKGRYNPTAEGEAVLNQAEDEEESPAAGSESHKYLGGFEVDNEEDMEWRRSCLLSTEKMCWLLVDCKYSSLYFLIETK